MKLPKQIEHDERFEKVVAALDDTRPLWSGGELRIPVVGLGEALRRALKSAQSAARITRGLELAEKKLTAESQGMQSADRRSGIDRGQRVSRMILISADGAERMRRRVETLTRRHPGRLIVLELECDGDELGEALFGPGQTAKLLMLDHKDAVSDALLALTAAD